MASLAEDAAIVVVDMQEDFCPPNGTLAVANGRDIAPLINKLLKLSFKRKIATSDFHPRDHISFASQHPGEEPFASIHTIYNPEAPNKDVAEYQIINLWPDHCVQGTPGSEHIPELDTFRCNQFIKKGVDSRFEALSAFGPPFRNPAVNMSILSGHLSEHGIKRVYVCGLALDFCVKATAIDAADLGYETFVVEDATKAVDVSKRGMQETRSEMLAHGVKLINSESLL